MVSLKEKWYVFSDWLEEKGIPVPLFFLLIILVVVGVFYALCTYYPEYCPLDLLGVTPGGEATLTVTVLDQDSEAIEGAFIEIKISGQPFKDGSTNADGEMEFIVPTGKEMEITASYEGASNSKKKTIYDDSSTTLRLDIPKEPAFLQRDLKFYDEGDSLLSGKKIYFSAACSVQDYAKDGQTSLGSYTFDDIPEDCGTLSVSVTDVSGLDIRPAGETFVITPENDAPLELTIIEEIRKGHVTVNVRTEDNGTPNRACHVTLNNISAGERRENVAVSTSTGTVQIRDIAIGTYEALLDCHGSFAVTESPEQKELHPGASISFAFKVRETLPEEIVVIIHEKDDDSKGVPGIKLRLYDGSKVSATSVTNEEGAHTFEVTPGKTYQLYAEKVGKGPLFSEKKNVSARIEPWKFPYDESILERFSALVVTVQDKQGAPIDKAMVEIFAMDDTPVGMEYKHTGIDGKVEYETMPAGSYYLVANRSGYESEKVSFSIYEEAETPEEVTAVLDIGQGQFKFIVMDSGGNAVSGAEIKGYNFTEPEETVAEWESNADGEAVFAIRVDKTVFFIVTTPGYMPFVTEQFKPLEGITTEVRALMLGDSEAKSIEASFSLELQGDEVREYLEAGVTYKARLRLVVPNKSYGTAGMHFRVGEDTEDQANTLEEDIVVIGSVHANAQKIVTGTSYSPPKGRGSDSTKSSAGIAKWADIEWNLGSNGMPAYGIFNATAEVMVDPDSIAIEGDPVKMSYRGWGAKGSYERDPMDSALGTAASSPQKQGLYAKTYDVIFAIGDIQLCDETGYCKVVTIEDLLTGSKVSVFSSEFTAKISNPYKLRFIVNKSGAGSVRNAKLKVSSEEQGLLFQNYKVKDALGGESSGKADSFEQEVDIGTLDQYKTFSGWIEFDTLKEGVNTLVLSIESDRSDEVMRQEIYVDVLEAREMKLGIVPREIIPLIDNQVVFRLYEEIDSEEISVQNARLGIELDGIEIGSGYTDSKGVYGIEIESPAAGSKLKITATKSGFKPLEREIEIDEKIFSLIPAEYILDMMPNSREEATITFSIENLTALPLKISNVSLSPDLAEYLKTVGAEQLAGIEVEAGETEEVSVQVKLTDKGTSVKKTVSLDAALNIELENADVAMKWSSDMTLKFRILLGGETDIRDCLVIEPNAWNINTYGDEKSYSFDFRNYCTVGGEEIPLRELEAKVSWLNENAVGIFTLVSDSFEQRLELALKESYVEITELLPAGFEGTVVITFRANSDTKSADLSPELLFRAKHYSEKGSEEIRAKVSTGISVNKLSECLRIVREEEEGEEIELRTLPYNQGWGLVQGYYDRDPYAEEAQQPQQQQPQWPTTQWQPPWATSQGYNPWQQQYSQWEPEEEEIGSFTLENACTDTVQVNLQVPSSLDVEEKTFDIAPYGSYVVEVKPGTRIGRFRIKVRAKLQSEQGFYREIDSVRVKVLRYEEISEKCKPTVEPTYFRANFLGWQKSAGRIINRCVDLGYRLSTITRNEFHCYRPDSGGTDMTGPCPLVEAVWSGVPTIQKLNDEESIEVLEFGLRYDPHIIDQLEIPLEGTLEQRVGQIRIVFSHLMNSIVSPGIISIPMTDPNGQQKWIPREVIFEDPFEWIGVAGMLISSGDPNKLPGECILNHDYFVLASWGDEWSEIGDSRFTENRFAWKENVPKREMLMPYAVSNDEALEQGFCGSSDKIVSATPTTYEDPDSGAKLSFRTTNGDHHVVMTVDRGGMFTRCAVIDTMLKVRVKRAFHNTEPSDAELPVRLTVLNRGVRTYTPGCEDEAIEVMPLPEWATGQACDPAYTGESAFLDLGFDRVKLDWRENDITVTQCEPQVNGAFNGDYIFCDGVQFTLALSKKFKEIRSLVDEISEKLQLELNPVATVIAEDESLLNEINDSPGKLYHVFKHQLVVNDSETGDNYLLFLEDSHVGLRVLEPDWIYEDSSCKAADLLADLVDIKENMTAETEYSASQELQRIVSDKFKKNLKNCYGKDIDEKGFVGLIPDGIDDLMVPTTEAGEIWRTFTIDNSVFEYYDGDDFQAYLLTFNEYNKLHNDLLIQWRDSAEGENLTATVGGVSVTATGEGWLDFLQNLYDADIEFKIGIRNKAGISEETEEFIREKAANALDEDLTTLGSTQLASARLIRDNYSETFVSHFTEKYANLEFSAGQIEFRQYTNYSDEKGFSDELSTNIDYTGEYLYRIEPYVMLDVSQRGSYTIVLEKMLVKMALDKSIAVISQEENNSYANNPFFYLPFDGEVGGGMANADYGVGFNRDIGESMEIFYTYEGASRWTKPVRRMPGITTLSPEYSEKYEKTRTGRILSINRNKGTFTYTPSYPVALKASWESGANNMLYYGLDPVTYYGNVSKISELMVWWPFYGTGTSEEGRSDQFGETEPDILCDGWADSRLAAKVMLGSTSPWNSVAFVPANAGGLRLDLVCAKEATVLTAMPYEGTEESASTREAGAGGFVSLNDRRESLASIQEYIDKIYAEEVCINKTLSPNFIELHWNEYIYGLTDEFIIGYAEAE